MIGRSPASTADQLPQGRSLTRLTVGGSPDEISVVDVHKSFGVTKALDGCSFSAKCGEIHAIVGGNGCGKSTLAKVLSGVLPIDSGQVSVLGHTPQSPHDARAIHIATVFQEILVADECSVVDNLFVGSDGLWSKSIPTNIKMSTAEQLMKDLTGLDIDPRTPVEGLPLSIKQWITIGRALLRNPKVLILDESSAALDLDYTEKLFSKMREFRDQGSAVIIVTHRIAELIRVSDRATVMRDGQDVGVLEKGEITEKNLLSLMTGKSEEGGSQDRELPQREDDAVVMSVHGMRVWPNAPAIDFELSRSEIVGVAGLDGQGQNEFVRALAGVHPALDGVARARSSNGDYQGIGGLADAERLRIAYVSGDRKREGIIPNLSIFENLLLPLYRKHLRLDWLGIIDWTALSGIFDWGVERLSIKIGDRSNKVTSLSGGNQQKVLVGRSFAMQPDILILNDPARGIDVKAKKELYKHLHEFTQRGHAVVFMSSELEEFIGLCNRVIVFRHGSIFDTFSGAEIEPVKILEAMFGQSSGNRQNRQKSTQSDDGEKSHFVPFKYIKEKKEKRHIVKKIKVIDFDQPIKSDRRTKATLAGVDVEKIKIVYTDE